MATTTQVGTSSGKLAVLSANGRYVAFSGSLFPELFDLNDRNAANDVFVQDLDTKLVYAVSVSSDEGYGNRSSEEPVISTDGRFIVFSSDATNLVPGDTNGETDLFRRDTIAGTTIRVSLDSNGNQVPAGSNDVLYRHSLSADGRFVAFQSNAQLAGVPTPHKDIFVRDVVAGTTTIVSVNSSGQQANLDSFAPSISADGRFVAFDSLASNLVAGDTFNSSDVFVHDRLTGTTTLVSANSQGQKGSGVSANESVAFQSRAGDAVISPNGRYVVFESSYTNLVPNDTNGVTDVFMRDLQTGITTRISVDSNGNQANGSSAIGYVKSSAISADGRYVVFQSVANNLVPGDTNNAQDVFVRDTVAGTTTRVSVNSRGEEPVAGFLGTASYDGTISADGSRIVFISNGRNLTDTPSSTSVGFDKIYLRDFGSSRSSPAPGNPSANPGSKMTGNARNNTLTGTPGNDTLHGKGGRDTLIGAAGDDVLIGGKGGDVLTGGAGRDRFVYQHPQDRVDRITDFTVGEDKIVLTQLLDRLVPGNYRGRNAFQDKLLRLVRQGTNTRIDADLNGRAEAGGFKPLILVEDVASAALKALNNFVF
ncbi:MAG: PD40 domain-containing protein [Synechococcales cyanobacterium C42_A2020_086]|nr:PD40 domain-containing protein [Synechococcales cyanobacterium C42_A2020_086]